MSCTIFYVTNDGEPGVPKISGNLPRKPVQWTVSVWVIWIDGEKTTHSLTVPLCLSGDLIQAISERLHAIAQEKAQLCTQFGWTASARGGKKRR